MSWMQVFMNAKFMPTYVGLAISRRWKLLRKEGPNCQTLDSYYNFLESTNEYISSHKAFRSLQPGDKIHFIQRV